VVVRCPLPVAGGKILALASVCRNDPKPVEARGGAMLGGAFASGLRLSELIGLLADLKPRARRARRTRLVSAKLAARSLDGFIHSE